VPPKRKPVKRSPVKRKPVKRKPVKRKPVKRKPVKRKPVKRKPVKRKAVKRKPVKRKPVKRKPVKRKPVKRKPAKRARPVERQADLGDAVIASNDWRPQADYQAYPIPEAPTSIYRAALDRLDAVFGAGRDGDDDDDDDGPQIVWLPSFDEVYDYIDGLVEDYDLDHNELFEWAFGYTDSDAA
jgi:hypothetical protein